MHSIALRLLPAALLLVPSCLAPVTAPNAANGSVNAAATDGARVDELFAECDTNDSPGCSIAVIRDGKIVYARGYGMANLELAVRNGRETVFDIGSTSKQFTAASILLLAADGKLSVDDDIRKHLPELRDYGKPITIRHLLHHTSGIRDYLELFGMAGLGTEGLTTNADALAMIARQQELNFPPGEEHLYSNSGYCLLSIIVERVSGKPIAVFARERIFEPLGMKSTHFHDDHMLIVPRRATGYVPREKDGFGIAMSDFEQTGDGAVMTTVEDLARWDANFYDPKVGGPQLLAALQEKGKLNDGKEIDYARGLMRGTHGGRNIVAHGGAWAGYRAEMLRFPDQRLSVICLANLGTFDPTSLAMKVADVYLPPAPEEKKEPAGEKPKAASAPSFGDVAAYAGVYRDAKTGQVRTVTASDGKLEIRIGGITVDLVPIAPGRFAADKMRAEVVFETKRYRVVRDGKDAAVYETFEPWKPTAEELASLAGLYDSEELGVTHRIDLVNGEIVLKTSMGADLVKPAPTVQDEFGAGGLRITFVRNGDRKVTGFRLASGRVRNVGFTRREPPR